MRSSNDHHIPAELFEMAQKVRADRTNVEKDEIGNTQRKAKKYTAAGLEIVDEDGLYYIKKERIAPSESVLKWKGQILFPIRNAIIINQETIL